jgi:hypothetical protein
MSTLRKNNWMWTGAQSLNAVAKNTTTAGPTLDMTLVKDGTLSAFFTTVCDTNTMTIEVLWQGSNDAGAHWYPIVEPGNPTPLVLATGTAGADAEVQFYVQAPWACYGLSAVRLCLINKVAAGGATDTYAIGYCFEATSSA